MAVRNNAVYSGSGRLVAVAELHAADMAWLHEQAMIAAWGGGKTVELDLSRVTSWSSVAQAMVVGLASDLVEQDSRLILSGASLGLRRQCRRLDVFQRVRALSD